MKRIADFSDILESTEKRFIRAWSLQNRVKEITRKLVGLK